MWILGHDEDPKIQRASNVKHVTTTANADDMTKHATLALIPVLLLHLTTFSLSSSHSSTPAPSFPRPCCTDQHNKPYPKCRCLENNKVQTNYHLSTGETLFFHWRLTDLNLANVQDAQRATIKIHTLACWGQMVTHVKGFAIDFPDEKTAWYSHNGTNGHGKIKFPFIHSNYLISVNSAVGGNFSIVATTQYNLVPIPGQNGDIDLKQISQNAVEVTWSAVDSLVPVKYELYYNLFDNVQREQNLSTAQVKTCQERGTSMGPCAKERAIMNSPCGCRRNGILATTVYGDTVETSTASSTSSGLLGSSTTKSSNTNNKNGRRTLLSTTFDSTNKVRVYRAVINDLPLNRPIFVNVLAMPTQALYKQYEVTYNGRSIAMSFDRVVSVFDETMMHVYIAAGAYGMVGVLLIVASIQRSRILSFSQVQDGGHVLRR